MRAGFGAASAGPEAGLPFMVTLTPEARKRPPKRLLKIWLPSKVAVAWLVISIPEGGGTGQSRHPIMSQAKRATQTDTVRLVELTPADGEEPNTVSFSQSKSPAGFKGGNFSLNVETSSHLFTI